MQNSKTWFSDRFIDSMAAQERFRRIQRLDGTVKAVSAACHWASEIADLAGAPGPVKRDLIQRVRARLIS